MKEQETASGGNYAEIRIKRSQVCVVLGCQTVLELHFKSKDLCI